ncbi:hypothetical protein NEIFLAOT_01250 [Neisseria flavescens NRL30031/H210]|uniref:Uncharacterized protein n=1 Tax=Neisseria flavescens NRL30031/H210 TaxID=546264 RepID=C0EMS4_NEIFL|nr:hypothetical protein NEIFLAOT_01250 [Neisseria flavescens NRL30031/H210]
MGRKRPSENCFSDGLFPSKRFIPLISLCLSTRRSLPRPFVPSGMNFKLAPLMQ